MDATSALGNLVGLDLDNYEEFKETESQINQERRDRLDANEGTLGDNIVLGGEALSEGARRWCPCSCDGCWTHC